ncbi:MAG: phosphotransferase [Dehalococcoidia bacterium]
MDRPEAPEPSLLAEAAVSLQRTTSNEAPITWEVVERIERPRSTIFRLQAPVGTNRVDAFYKADLRGATDQQGTKNAADVLRIEACLNLELQSEFRRISANHDLLLASDPDRLAAVRMGVPGRPLGSALRWLPRWRRAATVFENIGTTLAAVEHVGRTLPLPPGTPDVLGFVELTLDRAKPQLTKRSAASIQHELRSLADEPNRELNLVWAHNDLSGSNILVDGQTVGIIDFSWAPRPQHSDLAHLHARIECERLSAPAWTKRALSDLRRGRGLEPHVDLSLADPAWRVALIERALRFIPRSGNRRRNTAAEWGWRTLRGLGHTG